MKKMPKTAVLAISIVLLGLLWVFAVAAYTIGFKLPRMCWGSIVCTVIAIIAADVYLLVLRKDADEPGAIGIIFTICYLLITVLLNSVFALVGCGDFNWLLLTLNIVAIVCYIVLLLWVEQSTTGLTNKMVKTEQKTNPSVEISRKLGELLAITEDAEVRGKLLKLKEAVDYGTNISTGATSAKEQQMNELLDEIVQLTITNADRLIVLKKVDAAALTWKMRSSTASSIR